MGQGMERHGCGTVTDRDSCLHYAWMVKRGQKVVAEAEANVAVTAT